MATHPHDFGRASALPLSRALAIIPSLPRPLLSRLVARAIERLDEMDGDPDLEANGDELDGTHAEDEEGNHLGRLLGLGCSISDPPEEDDHGGGNVEDEGELEHDAECETWPTQGAQWECGS